MKIRQQLKVAKPLLACCVTLLLSSNNCKISNATGSLLHRRTEKLNHDQKKENHSNGFWCAVFFAADVEASSVSDAPTQYLNMSHPCVIYRSCKSFNLLCSSAVHVGLWFFFLFLFFFYLNYYKSGIANKFALGTEKSFLRVVGGESASSWGWLVFGFSTFLMFVD